MKTINELEQEAKQAREELCIEMVSYLPINATNAGIIADKLILASVAMVTYQLALGMQEISGDGSSESLPEVSKEERNSDGWIEWHGKGMPNLFWLDVKFRNGQILNNCFSDELRWWHAKDKNGICDEGLDIVAYKVASGKDNNAKLADIKSKKEN